MAGPALFWAAVPVDTKTLAPTIDPTPRSRNCQPLSFRFMVPPESMWLLINFHHFIRHHQMIGDE